MRNALLWAVTQRVGVISYTDVSGQPIGPVFKRQEEGLLAPEDGTDRYYRNVRIRNYHYSLRNSPEERSSHSFI